MTCDLTNVHTVAPFLKAIKLNLFNYNIHSLVILQVDQLGQNGYDVTVLVHKSNKVRDSYDKFSTAGCAEEYLKSPHVINSWKEHCSKYKTENHSTSDSVSKSVAESGERSQLQSSENLTSLAQSLSHVIKHLPSLEGYLKQLQSGSNVQP